MKVLVVDDELPARRRLVRMLERLAGVEVAAEASDGEEALAMVARHAPDMILLDIDMPEMDGLELAEQPDLPPIVFTTAHAEHALRAFELAAVDYLLKPISAERLTEAIGRIRTRTGLESREGVAARPRITARSGSTVHVIDAHDIDRFHAEDKCSVFFHRGRELVLDDTLVALEKRLAAHGFFRSHRSELIRLEAVVALHVDGPGVQVELTDGSRAAVGRRMLGELKRRLGIG